MLVVGATGSLGTVLVPELERSGIPLRILGRSRESFVKAGLDSKKDVELVICADVTDRGAFRDEWFEDVKAVVCVARPRAGKPGDGEAFVSLLENLSDFVCTNRVPHMLLLGIPYMDQFLFGLTPRAEATQASEVSLRERFEAAADSELSIVRIAEMSEIGILLDMARKSRVWPCMMGYNPRVQPITARDFAAAVAGLLGDAEAKWKPQLLWGGPQVFTWRQLGSLMEDAAGKRMLFIPVPFIFWQTLIYMFQFAGMFIPVSNRMAVVLQLTGMIMTANATSDRHEKFGKDSVEAYLKEHSKPEVDMLASR